MKPFGAAEVMRWVTGAPTIAEARAAAPLYPGPAGREETQLETIVLGKMQENSGCVEELLPPHGDERVPTQHRLRVVAEGAGGAVIEATVYSNNKGEYQGLRMEGLPVAERLGGKHATLFSNPDGTVHGERWRATAEDSADLIMVDSGWRKRLPWRFRTVGRIGMQFWNGKALPSVQEPQQ